THPTSAPPRNRLSARHFSLALANLRHDSHDDDLSFRGEDRDPVERPEVGNADDRADVHLGDVDVDALGHVPGQTFDVQLPEMVLEHAALFHSLGFAFEVDRHVDGDGNV